MLPFPVREWAEHQTTFAMLEEQKLALVQYLASLANSMGIRAAIQFTSITSTKHRAHMQVSSSDHCERAILSTVSIFAIGQIKEECLLRNVESWKSWSFPDSWNVVSRRFSVVSAAVWLFPQIQSLPGITLPHSVRSEIEQSIEQLLPCWKHKHLPEFNVLSVLPIDGAFVQQSSSQ